MPSIPRDPAFDSTLALLSEGYPFIQTRCRRYESDFFETRLMLQRAVCVTGAEAAEMFYEPGRFTRRRALPLTALLLLQDKGSVSVQDGAAHRRRKEMFMSLMGPEQIQQLTERFAEEWRARIEQWKHQDEVVLHREVQAVLCRAVCGWAGVPLTEAETQKRTREFAAMVDGAGAVGPRNWWGHLLRARTEGWMRNFIKKVRAGAVEVPEGSAARVIAEHRDREGRLLDVKTAAVELINVLRPVVAVARFVTFAALALHQYPTCRQRLKAGNESNASESDLECFVQEVRRFYPFFPCVGGRAKEAFDWRGCSFERGTWVLLDLYGTDHDERTWEEPQAFRPERFADWDESAFDFIPQGGGDHFAGHRCAGEWITIALMKKAVRLLSEAMQYDVPEQDLEVPLSRMPTIPKSGFVIRNVRGRQ